MEQKKVFIDAGTLLYRNVFENPYIIKMSKWHIFLIGTLNAAFCFLEDVVLKQRLN